MILIVLSLLGASTFGWYLTTGKPLTQLPGIATDGMPHYMFSIYGVNRPSSVSISPDRDRIYVVEGGAPRRVVVFDNVGKQTGVLTPPLTEGNAHGPVYAAVNPVTSEVYVSDRQTSSIYIYSAQGVFKSVFKPIEETPTPWEPLGLAFDKDGNLYVSDVSTKPHLVKEFNPLGSLVRTIGSTNGLQFPNAMTVDSDNKLYVSDSNNGRVLIFDLDGKSIASINRGVGEGDLGMPRGVVIDDTNRLFVVDTANHMVKVYRVQTGKTPTPKYLGSFGDEGQADATFEYPNGITADAHARIYITDRENNRVQVWSF
jgi:DNA-binding beta-propeller fold protein YncE